MLDFATRAKLEDWSADPAFGVVVGRGASEVRRTLIQSAADDLGGRVFFSRRDAGRPSGPAGAAALDVLDKPRRSAK